MLCVRIFCVKLEQASSSTPICIVTFIHIWESCLPLYSPSQSLTPSHTADSSYLIAQARGFFKL